LGLLLAGGATLAAPSTVPDNEEHARNPEVIAASSGPVVIRLGNRKLFDITTGIDSLTTAQRAEAIETRLVSLANGPATVLQSLRVAEQNDISDLFAGDLLIRTVTEQDAVDGGTTRQHLAAEQMRRNPHHEPKAW
jgi:hypothetical protein